MMRTGVFLRFHRWQHRAAAAATTRRFASTKISRALSRRGVYYDSNRTMHNDMVLHNGYRCFASTISTPFISNNETPELTLKQKTEQFLLANNNSTVMMMDNKQLIALMQEWMTRDNNNIDSTVVADHVDKLFQCWLGQYSPKNLPTTAIPFELTVRAWRNASDGNQAAAVLDEWGHLLEGDMTLAPSLEAFHLVMDAYSKTCNGLDAVEDLLLLLQQWHTAGNVWSQPRVETFGHVVRAMVRQEQDEDGVKQMQRRVLDMLEKLQHAYPQKLVVEPVDVYFLVRAYSDVIEWMETTKGTTTRDSHETFELLNQMEASIHNQDLALVASQTGPDVNDEKEQLESCLGRAYLSVIKKLVGSSEKRKVDTAEIIHDMLDRLEQFGGDWSMLPWVEHYEASIQALADCVVPANQAGSNNSNVQPEDMCEDMLKRMEARHLTLPIDDENHESEPSGKSSRVPLKPYERVLFAMSRCGRGDKAEALLAHVMKLRKYSRLSKVIPTELTRCWNHAMMAHSHERRNDLVLELWRAMKAFKVKPDSVTYATVLKALSRSSERHAAKVAHSILEKMVRVYNQKGPNGAVKPNATHYGHVITAWSRSPDRNAARQAQMVLTQLEHEYKRHPSTEMKPTMAHYSAVITVLARSSDRDAVEKAEELFQTMQDHADESLQPDIVAYGALMDALSRRKCPEAAERAEELLDHLEYVSKEGGQKHMRPNKVCYSSVVTAWARSGVIEAPERAEAVLKRLEHAYAESKDESLCPDAFAFAAVLGAWSNSGHAHSGDRAEELLSIMEKQAVPPNTVVYTNVIRSHWRSGRPDAAEKAESILNRMEQSYAEGDLDAKPDTLTYTCVINAWARSGSPKKAQRAWDLLQRMCHAYEKGSLDVRPNVITFTSVLNACAYTRGSEADREQAIKIALMVLTELLPNYDKPNHITFRTLLEVFGKQARNDRERLKLSSAAFEKCVEEGQVDSSVLDALGRFVPKLYENLPRDDQSEIRVPAEWSRNVKLRGFQ